MPKCKICDKSVFPMDPQINLDGDIIHNTCAKCEDCRCQITLSNFVKNSNQDSTLLLCKTHYKKRFLEKGLSYFSFRIIFDILFFTLHFFRFIGQYIGGEKYGKKTEGELRSPVSGTVTPVNSTTSESVTSTETVPTPTLTVKEITRRLSVSKAPTPKDKEAPASEVSAEAEK